MFYISFLSSPLLQVYESTGIQILTDLSFITSCETITDAVNEPEYESEPEPEAEPISGGKWSKIKVGHESYFVYAANSKELKLHFESVHDCMRGGIYRKL